MTAIVLATLHGGLVANPLSLDELFRIAEEQSEELRVAYTAINSASEERKAAQLACTPQLDIALSVGYLGNGQLGERDFTHWQTIENPHFMNNFSVKASQVIYSGGALTSAIRLSKIGQEMAELNLQQHRQEIRLLIAGQYLDICRAENQLNVIRENIALVDTLILHTRAKAAQGTVLETDIMRHELHREQLLLTQRQITDAIRVLRYQLSTTLHTDLSQTNFHAIDSVNILTSLEEWQEHAQADNIAIAQSAKSVSISEQQVRLQQSQLIPKIALVAENHFDGPITIDVPVIDKNFNYWFVGIGVQYALSSLWQKTKTVKKARFDLQQSREQQALVAENIHKAVQATYTQLMTSKATLQMREKSQELAIAHYDVTYNRYQNGLCLLTDMLDAVSSRLDAETALVNTKIDILYNYYQLKYLISSL